MLEIKKEYKALRKGLKNSFTRDGDMDYSTKGAVLDWIKQSGLKVTEVKFHIICKINGSVPYPYQKKDRKKVLKYLKKNSYKEFKNDY
ncbi:hypothetical protein TPMD03_37 [Thiohalocapsa phage LS06-2018-MD03]|nr:hypothetical protein TPMD03_37 [Thiohalocapsa phage LS06-2018-MD03]